MVEDVKREVKTIKLKYGLAANADVDIFMNMCTELLNDGWELVGGVAICYPNNGHIQWAQAFKRKILV